jgi:HK97 gp10 family phage protein
MATVEGSEKVVANLKKVQNTARNRLEQGLLNSALIVERDAKKKAPVDTGRLRDSITHETDFGSGDPSVTVGTNVEYAPYVEFGSSKAAAQPFLYPALTENKSKILKEIAKALRSGL